LGFLGSFGPIGAAIASELGLPLAVFGATYGVTHALLQGNYPLAVYRAVLGIFFFRLGAKAIYIEPAAGGKTTVYTLSNVPINPNRPPTAVPPGAPAPPARSFGGTYILTKNPMDMTPQEFHGFVSNNLFANPFPKRLTVIEVPQGGVNIDPSIPNPQPGTGHIPAYSGARVTKVYEITYDQSGTPIFKKIEGN